MYFKTVIKNNLSHERRLMWLKGGLTIDGNGFQVMEGCWPDRCNDAERRGFLNELESQSISVTYVTDLPTIVPEDLDSLLTGGCVPVVEEPAAVAVPVKAEVIAEKSEEIPPAIRKLQEQARKMFDAANKEAFKYGAVEAEPKRAEVDLTSKLAFEGSIEDFQQSRTAFTSDDAQAFAEIPAATPALKDRTEAKHFGKPVQEVFTEMVPAVQPVEAKEAAPAVQPVEAKEAAPASQVEAIKVETPAVQPAEGQPVQKQRGRRKGS